MGELFAALGIDAAELRSAEMVFEQDCLNEGIKLLNDWEVISYGEA